MVSVKESVAVEDVGVLGEEAEDEPRHEVVHVVTASSGAPLRIGPQQLHVKLGKPPGCPDVDGVVLDLTDRGDTSQREEEAEVIGEIRKEVRNRLLPAGQIFGFEIAAVSGEDKLGPGRGCLRACLEALEHLPRLPRRARGDMDRVDQQHRARNIRLVGVALAQALEGGFLLVEGRQKSEWELSGVVLFRRKFGYRCLNLNCVHRTYLAESIADLELSSFHLGGRRT
jgi:hypothetical protein